MRSNYCPWKDNTAELPRSLGNLLVPFHDTCSRAALHPVPEELCPPLSNCLSALNTFCSSLEAHCNQLVQPNLAATLESSNWLSKSSQHYCSNCRWTGGRVLVFRCFSKSHHDTCSFSQGNWDTERWSELPQTPQQSQEESPAHLAARLPALPRPCCFMCTTYYKVPADTGALQQAAPKAPNLSLAVQDVGGMGCVLIAKGLPCDIKAQTHFVSKQVQEKCWALMELKPWRVVRIISWIICAQSTGF